MTRVIVLLGLAMVVMLLAAALRAEGRRLHHEVALLDAQSADLERRLAQRELEFARLSNPAQIRERAEKLRNASATAPAAAP